MKPIFGLIESGRFRQVLLYVKQNCTQKVQCLPFWISEGCYQFIYRRMNGIHKIARVCKASWSLLDLVPLQGVPLEICNMKLRGLLSIYL